MEARRANADNAAVPLAEHARAGDALTTSDTYATRSGARRDTMAMRSALIRQAIPSLNAAIMLPRLNLRGCVRRSWNLSADFLGRGHGVAVLSPGGPLLHSFERIDVTLLHSHSEGWGLRRVFNAIDLRQRLARFEPGLLHAASTSLCRPAGALARAMGVPMIVTVQSVREAMRLTRRAIQSAQTFIAVSHEVRESLVNHAGVERGSAEVILPGVSALGEEEFERRRARETNDIPVVACAGPLADEKAVLSFLRAAQLLIAGGRQARFLVIGDGPASAAVRRWIADEGMSRWAVLVTELYDYGEMYAAVDVAIAVDESHESSFLALEAMGQGVPLVASGYGGNFELIEDEISGAIYQPGDAHALAARIDWMLEHPAERRAMARAGWQRVRDRFNVRMMADATLDLYRRCVETFRERNGTL